MTKRKAVTAPRAGRSGAARADLSKPASADAAATAGSGPAGDGAPVAGSGAAGDGAPVVGDGPAGDGAPVVGDGPAVGGGPVLGKGPATGDDAASGGDGSAEPPATPDPAATGGAEPYAPDSGFAVPGDDSAPEPEAAGGSLDTVIAVGGLVVAVLLALALAVFEAFLAPLRVSDLGLSGTGKNNMRVPLALVLALVTNPMLVWFAFTTTGRRFAPLLPAGAWCVVWILAAGRTTEGDLLITADNWLGLLTLFAGSMAFAISIYVMVLRQRVAASANSKATHLAPQSVKQVDTFPHRP
ncbi:hypothetical protein [Dactylosporangium sp. NPDC000521]|uniref:hypothetical protein n=1 Tax=Dactylosporangium sp. NPDC000521 TaxID=3363975 RepID=UPI0036A8466B